MISKEREQALLQIKDAARFFAALYEELGLSQQERLPLSATTPALAKHALSFDRSSLVDDIREDTGLNRYLRREREGQGQGK